MFTHPDPIGQLAAEHYQHMLAQARQRTLRHQHGRRSSTLPEAAVRITRRLATVITRAEGVAAKTPGRHLVRPAVPAQRVSHRSPAIRATATDAEHAPRHINSRVMKSGNRTRSGAFAGRTDEGQPSGFSTP